MTIWHKADIRPLDKFSSQTTFKNLANVNKGDSTLEEYRNPKKIEEQKIFGVAKNELLLGTVDEESSIPVTLPYDGKSRGILIVAQKGAGKTQLAKFLAFTQFYERYHYNIFAICPKKEDYSNLNEPQSNPSLVRKLAKFNIRPKGYDAVYYKPAYLNLHDRDAIEYIVTLRDFDNLDYGKRAESLKEFFNIDERTPAGRALSSVLYEGVPKTTTALFDKLKKYKIKLIKDRQESAADAGLKGGSKMVSSALDIEIKRQIAEGILGDNGQKITREVDDKGRPTKVVIAKSSHFVEDLYERRPVVLHVDLTAERNYVSSCYVKLAIAGLWENRRKYVDSSGRSGIAIGPTFTLFDEADVLMPSNQVRRWPSREQLNQLLSKGRQYGWGVIAITQQPEKISQEFIKHVDYIFTTRLQNANLIRIVKDKYAITDAQIEELQRIRYDQNKKTQSWICFTGNPEAPYKIFEPLPPSIQIVEEKVPTVF